MLLVAIFAFYQTACTYTNGQKKNAAAKEFEGIITYHEIAKFPDSSLNQDDTVSFLYSKGNYVSIHSAKSPKFHIIKDYYLESEPLRLYLFSNSDTLHQFELSSSIERLESFTVKKMSDKVLSRNCEKLEVNTSYHKQNSITYTDFTFIFSRDYLRVNKEHFKHWKIGFFDKVIDETGAYYLNFKAVHYDSSHKNILSSKTYEVISVQEKPINPMVFKIDSTKIKRYE